MAPKNTNIPQNRAIFFYPKQLVLAITHVVKINTVVSTESTYCPPPSSVSLLRSWSEILGCKVGPHFVANAYEFIHDQNTRRARASKFIRIYIDFRYAGVSTATSQNADKSGTYIFTSSPSEKTWSRDKKQQPMSSTPS